MILWINGAFGSGKTQTAFELNRILPNSYVYDPENVGYFLRKNQPKSMQIDNFQDEPLWREFNFKMLKNISDNYNGTIIVPMTIFKEDYFNDIITKLRESGVSVDHYVLGASKKIILKRLRKRFENKNSWAATQIDNCIDGFKHPIFENYIDTEYLTIEQNAKFIAINSKLEFIDIQINLFQKILRKILTQIKHIRRN